MFELWDILVLVFMMLFSGKKKQKTPLYGLPEAREKVQKGWIVMQAKWNLNYQIFLFIESIINPFYIRISAFLLFCNCCFRHSWTNWTWFHFQTFLKDTITNQREHNEVDGGPHAILYASLRADPVIHHLVPVFTCQNLQVKANKASDSKATRRKRTDMVMK